MTILAIETSCDETAVAVLEAGESEGATRFRVRGNALLSQIDIHREYGGVYPMLAKREHAKNLVPLLASALEEAELLHEDAQAIDPGLLTEALQLLEREPGLSEAFSAFIRETERPALDAIAVTAGPGLAPALWVGVNFAKALSRVWGIPLVAVNHMEGHLLAALAQPQEDGSLMVGTQGLPVVALLISGGHTELVLMNEWRKYTVLGTTRDDAVGEAFDKVARMLDLPYPGGPEISRLAERDREDARTNPFSLPRPMLHTDDLDFSFSGLKTAVLYIVKARPELSETEKAQLARAFEDAVAEVLIKKTARALADTGARTLVMGGGVAGNTHLQRVFAERLSSEFPSVTLAIPSRELTTDNAVMIGLAGYYAARDRDYADPTTLAADGNLSLG